MNLLSKLVSIFSPKSGIEEAESVVERLIDLGYLKFVPESDKPLIRAQLIKSIRSRYLHSDWGDDCISADKRSYSADVEELAAGGVGECILKMKNVLLQEGVSLESVEDDFAKHKYQVVINGKGHFVYDHIVPERASSVISEIQLREIVNSLLREADSDERIFGLFGGSDDRFILLTPELYDLFWEAGVVFDKRSMPYSAAQMKMGE